MFLVISMLSLVRYWHIFQGNFHCSCVLRPGIVTRDLAQRVCLHIDMFDGLSARSKPRRGKVGDSVERWCMQKSSQPYSSVTGT